MKAIKGVLWIILVILTAACANQQTADMPGETVQTTTAEPSTLPTRTAIPIPPTPTITNTSSPTPIPPTATPAPVERITFTVQDPDSWMLYESIIWYMNSDGTGILFPIFQDEIIYGSRGYLAWSHDGRYLAFDGGDTVSCPDILGTECYDINYGTFVRDYSINTILYHIEDTTRNVSWSPDNPQIVFSLLNRGEIIDADLYILDVESGQQRQLTEGPSNDLYPSWSPDGQWIAFIRFVRGAPGCGSSSSVPFWTMNENCDPARLYMVRPDGSDLQMLHESVFLYQEIGWSQVVNHAPAWSPDSKRLAFVTRNESERNSPNDSNITILNVETGEWQFVGAGNGTSISPSWSPDGKKLIFASNRDHRNFYIYRLDLDENTVVNLTSTDENFDLSPTWSLSGAHIAYLHWTELVIMNADGTNKVIIGEEGMGIVRGIPAWLPNP